jgi:hypothetical protein
MIIGPPPKFHGERGILVCVDVRTRGTPLACDFSAPHELTPRDSEVNSEEK